jgi:lipoprotein signal peptidase
MNGLDLRGWRIVGLSAGMAVLVVLVDQFSKAWVAPYFNLAITLNPAGAGSIPWLGNHATGWLWGGGVVLLGLSFWAIHQLRHTPNQWPAWGLILGGGVSNWLDRWHWQGVRDWLTVPGLELKNNLADYALTMGIIWLVINWMKVSRMAKS